MLIKIFRWITLAMFITTPLVSMSQASDLTITIKKNYYNISGQTVKELRREMKTYGPPKNTGKYWGYTERTNPRRQSRCAFDLTITYTLPNWVDQQSAPIELQKKWNRMYPKLVQHEEGHGKYALREAKERLQAKCRFKRQIKARRKFRNRIYDAVTLHGLMTGVHLFW